MKYLIFTPYQQGYQQFIFDFKFSFGILNLNLKHFSYPHSESHL